jgi:hypothetical protein
LLGQQPQRPLAEAGRRLAQAQGDQFRLGHAVEQLRRRRRCPFFTNQRPFETFQDEGLPHVLNRLSPAPNRLADFGVTPSRPTRVGLEQNRRSPELLRLALFFLDGRLANRPLLVGEPHDILLVHRNLLVEGEVPQNGGSDNPKIKSGLGTSSNS